MAKRIKLGSLVKNKEKGKENYLKLDLMEPLTLKKGQYINFATKQQRVESLKKALEAGKISEESHSKMMGFLEKEPDFVIAEAYVVIE